MMLSGTTLICVVAFDRVIPFHLAVPSMVFGEGLPDDDRVRVVVCAGERGPLRTTAGFSLSDLAPLSLVDEAHAVVIPGWRDITERPPPALLEALRAAHARGAQIVSLCLGTFVLAEAGLLDGRRATTHWEGVDELAQRFPRVHVDPDVLYVEDGNVLTSAGTAASLDACLYMLRQRLGAVAANRAARRLVVAPLREGGQLQCVAQPVPENASGLRLARLLDAMRARLGEDHCLDSLALEANMSRRSFTRHFKALTGTTVQAWLLNERLLYAQRMLEGTDRAIARIADSAGFGSIASLREHFRQAFGVSPARWRNGYRSSGSPVSAEHVENPSRAGVPLA